MYSVCTKSECFQTKLSLIAPIIPCTSLEKLEKKKKFRKDLLNHANFLLQFKNWIRIDNTCSLGLFQRNNPN